MALRDTVDVRPAIGAHLAIGAIALCGGLLPTGLVWAADIVEAAAPDGSGVVFSVGAGPAWLDLPDIDTDLVRGFDGPDADGRAEGVRLSTSIGAQLGELGGIPLFVGLNATFVDADGSTRDVAAPPAGVPLVLTGGASAGDAIELTTAVDATGARAVSTVSVTDPFGGTGLVEQDTTSPPGANATNLVARTPTRGGVAFGNVSTNGASLSATAIGLTGDADGFTLAAIGDLSDVDLVTTTQQSIDYGEIEAGFAGAIELGQSGFVAVPTIAPAYRYMSRDVDTSLAVLLPSDPLNNSRASATFSARDRMTAHYAGGSIGLSFVGPVLDDLVLSAGASAGALALFADLESTSALSVGSLRVGTSTIDFAPVRDELDAVAGFARATLGVTKPLGGALLSLNGQVEYLSDVPSVAREPGSIAEPDRVRLETDDALFYGAELSVSLTF